MTKNLIEPVTYTIISVRNMKRFHLNSRKMELVIALDGREGCGLLCGEYMSTYGFIERVWRVGVSCEWCGHGIV